MFGLKHILVPVDFSESSRSALRYAAELAQRLDARITVLHVNWIPAAYVGLDVMMPPSALPNHTLDDYTLRQAEKLLTALVTEVTPSLAPVIAREVRSGDAARGILDRAAVGDVDLVVMGTHGRSGLDHWLIGSIAEKVVRQASCPVLTVRHRHKASA